ncbi:LOW QUALITY PROTEIN: peptide methionine sulfoxide reductase MsrA 1-like [Parus major]|uniref:LOW QUALITY PROTEIN: peptide methionine sulfoxide reductase MsrA 1-like n=1 Tax=Parus major TaxID=9157 RepID=UPI0014448EA4|nr:LOW QUALITY PROTEIN: peptide methionine sulfoxide reductase MsrA 1-like [Parus major]
MALAMMKFAWDNYKQYALGKNELRPLTKNGHIGNMFGLTGHAEVVRVVFDPQKISYEELLKVFWENHDPTQGMRQQEDVGTQYRSVIYTLGPEQQGAALRSRDMYQQELGAERRGDITTTIEPAGDFYYAEDYHQQYLYKQPGAVPMSSSLSCHPTVPIAPSD